MNLNARKMLWKALDNGEAMGYAIADRARQIVELIDSLNQNGNDYSTQTFGKYAEQMVRSFKILEKVEPEYCTISTTLDLHHIGFNSIGLEEFLDWLTDKWESDGYIGFAREIGIW